MLLLLWLWCLTNRGTKHKDLLLPAMRQQRHLLQVRGRWRWWLLLMKMVQLVLWHVLLCCQLLEQVL
jgi:hypothetical protein